MEKKYTLKELLLHDNIYETSYVQSNIISNIEPEKFFNFYLTKINDRDKNTNIYFYTNPVMIFELDENTDLEFDNDNIFKIIALHLGDSIYDILHNVEIKINQKAYNLSIRKNANKIYFPIPFSILNNGSALIDSEINCFETVIKCTFTSYNSIHMIKKAYVQVEKTILFQNPNFLLINDYYNKMLLHDYSKKYTTCTYAEIKLYSDYKYNQCQSIDLNNFNDLNYIKKELYFEHMVDKFYIYFLNSDSQMFYSAQQFEKIKFIMNDVIILEYDYKTLHDLDSNNKLNYELPKGVFEIKFNIKEKVYEKNLSKIESGKFIIELFGVSVPKNHFIYICALTTNYIKYDGNYCHKYFAS